MFKWRTTSFFPKGDKIEIAMISLKYLKNFLHKYRANFNQNWKKTLVKKNPNFLQMKVSAFFPRGDNKKIATMHWPNLNIFFSKTKLHTSTKLGTKLPWVKGTHFTNSDCCVSNEENFNQFIHVRFYWKKQLKC